eukprot:9487285-Pyramimonas_sp.AAC.1
MSTSLASSSCSSSPSASDVDRSRIHKHGVRLSGGLAALDGPLPWFSQLAQVASLTRLAARSKSGVAAG